jgi:hypothetical protein
VEVEGKAEREREREREREGWRWDVEEIPSTGFSLPVDAPPAPITTQAVQVQEDLDRV